jgi:ribosomal protein L11 methyltransferase
MIVRALWQSRFTVPAGAVDLFVETFEQDVLSIAAFEVMDGSAAATVQETAPFWRVELLHDREPDRAGLERRMLSGGLPEVRLEIEPLPEADWVARVQTTQQPLGIGRFWLHGSHVEEEVPAGKTGILLDAGRAFGSGEHESTKGCLLALDRLARRRRFRRVLDMGAGAGVLGIAAAKIGAGRVVAVDNDPVAVEVAAENARLNGADGRMRCLVSDGYARPSIRQHGPYDLIFANILADPLVRMAGRLARHLAPGGSAVLAGILDWQADKVARAHLAYGLFLRRTVALGPWTTLVMSRTKH